MSKSFIYRLTKLPKYIKYIFPREKKILDTYFKRKTGYLQSLKDDKCKSTQILENDYSIEKCPKIEYFPRYTYTNLKKNTNNSYKNYGLPKKNKNLDYNPEAEKFLFGKNK